MISTQRILLILVCLNTVIGIAGDLYVQPTVYNADKLTDLEEYSTNLIDEFNNDQTQEANIRTQSTLQEPTWGSALQISTLIMTGFLKGITPFPFWTSTEDFNNVEQLIIGVLTIFQSLMYIILITEVFMLWKNRKTT